MGEAMGSALVKRIFLTLTVVGTFLLGGVRPRLSDRRSADVSRRTRKLLNYHVLTSVAALIFAGLVHAVLLTYFMGTGRWMDEPGRPIGSIRAGRRKPPAQVPHDPRHGGLHGAVDPEYSAGRALRRPAWTVPGGRLAVAGPPGFRL